MITIDPKIANETRLHHHAAELSDLQLDGFPREFMMPGVGNGEKFIPSREIRHHGELGGVVYHQLFGCVSCTLFND